MTDFANLRFQDPLWLWALWSANWRQRLASVGLAAAVVVAWAVPMIQLTGGWDTYRLIRPAAVPVRRACLFLS